MHVTEHTSQEAIQEVLLKERKARNPRVNGRCSSCQLKYCQCFSGTCRKCRKNPSTWYTSPPGMSLCAVCYEQD